MLRHVVGGCKGKVSLWVTHVTTAGWVGRERGRFGGVAPASPTRSQFEGRHRRFESPNKIPPPRRTTTIGAFAARPLQFPARANDRCNTQPGVCNAPPRDGARTTRLRVARAVSPSAGRMGEMPPGLVLMDRLCVWG